MYSYCNINYINSTGACVCVHVERRLTGICTFTNILNASMLHHHNMREHVYKQRDGEIYRTHLDSAPPPTHQERPCHQQQGQMVHHEGPPPVDKRCQSLGEFLGFGLAASGEAERVPLGQEVDGKVPHNEVSCRHKETRSSRRR